MPKHLSLHHTDMPIILSNYNLKSATHGHGTPNVFTGVRYHHRYYKPLTNSSPLSTCRASVLQKIKRQLRQCLPLLVAQLDSESTLQSSEYGAGSEIKGLPAPSERHQPPSLCMPGVHEGLLIIPAFRKQSRGSLE